MLESWRGPGSTRVHVCAVEPGQPTGDDRAHSDRIGGIGHPIRFTGRERLCGRDAVGNGAAQQRVQSIGRGVERSARIGRIDGQ